LSGFYTNPKENAMISKNPNEPQPAPAPGTKAETPLAPMDPHSPIEVASTGDGTVTDPSGHDKPPGIGGGHDSDLIA
jgi:hypothetical protein